MCDPRPPMISTRCVRTKMAKIGTRGVTDSLTPRMLRTMRSVITVNSIGTFQVCQARGSMLKTASPPEAIDTVMVRM